MLEQFEGTIGFDDAKSAVLVAYRAKLSVLGEGERCWARNILALEQFLKFLFTPVHFDESLGCGSHTYKIHRGAPMDLRIFVLQLFLV